MGIVIDIIVLAILILNIILGYKKGLVNAVFSICAFLIAIIATFILYKPVTNWVINNTEIDENITQRIISINIDDEEQEEAKDEENMTIFEKYIQNQVIEVAEQGAEEALEVVANTIANKAIEILVGIALFIVIRIVVIILKFVTQGIANLPIIRQFNKAGGIIYGILKAAIIIYVLLTIMLIVISVRGEGIIAEAISNSYITKFLYENIIIKTIAF